jgi:CheY-like chemotaxis protein
VNISLVRPRNAIDCPDRQPLRVLVVEDEEATAASLALLLRIFGHEVHIASDGFSALAASKASPPDVVLLDIGLPGMSGFEVAQRLLDQAIEKKPLLVAVTGLGGDLDRQRSEEAGIHFHLVKPADPDQLRALLERFHSVIAR